jgi:hypothetical protein
MNSISSASELANGIRPSTGFQLIDQIIYKLAKLNVRAAEQQQQQLQHQLTQYHEYNREATVLELSVKAKSSAEAAPVVTLAEEHIYEEIESNVDQIDYNINNASRFSNCSSPQAHEKKKCVRFGAAGQCNQQQSQRSTYMTMLDRECSHNSVVGVGSILKNSTPTQGALDCAINCTHLNGSTCVSSPSSSSSSSSSFSSSGIYMGAHSTSSGASSSSVHTVQFNQFVDEFLTQLSRRRAATINCTDTRASSESTKRTAAFKRLKQIINNSDKWTREANTLPTRRSEASSSNSSKTIDKRLSFRVTEYTLDDLKMRQRLISSSAAAASSVKQSSTPACIISRSVHDMNTAVKLTLPSISASSIEV